jgi:hypothetical protein
MERCGRVPLRLMEASSAKVPGGEERCRRSMFVYLWCLSDRRSEERKSIPIDWISAPPPLSVSWGYAATTGCYIRGLLSLRIRRRQLQLVHIFSDRTVINAARSWSSPPNILLMILLLANSSPVYFDDCDELNDLLKPISAHQI